MAKKRGAKTILIIEDETDIQNFAARVLELEGYQVLKANDGERGMEIIREYPVALVLLDLRLPGRDGWSILREIKRNPELSMIPVVVLTAIAETLQRKRTLRMGGYQVPYQTHECPSPGANYRQYSISGWETPRYPEKLR